MTRAVINALRKARPHVVIVAGGEHVTAMAEFSLTDCPALDYCVVGEGEETIVDLVSSLGTARSIVLFTSSRRPQSGRWCKSKISTSQVRH